MYVYVHVNVLYRVLYILGLSCCLSSKESNFYQISLNTQLSHLKNNLQSCTCIYKCYSMCVYAYVCVFRTRVKCRYLSRRVPARGVFPGATVVRGPDWRWGDQDGGLGSEGTVVGITGWHSESSVSVTRCRHYYLHMLGVLCCFALLFV